MSLGAGSKPRRAPAQDDKTLRLSVRIDTGLIAGVYDWTGIYVKAFLPKSVDKMCRILAISRED